MKKACAKFLQALNLAAGILTGFGAGSAAAMQPVLHRVDPCKAHAACMSRGIPPFA